MIVIGDEARDKMLKGINLVADAVKPTLGPMAKTVVLKERGRPIIVNDGVTVAKAVSDEDEFVDEEGDRWAKVDEYGDASYMWEYK